MEVSLSSSEEYSMGTRFAWERGECEYWYKNTFLEECELIKKIGKINFNIPLDVNKKTKEVKIDFATLAILGVNTNTLLFETITKILNGENHNPIVDYRG